MNDFRSRMLALTCPAGLAGLPQVAQHGKSPLPPPPSLTRASLVLTLLLLLRAILAAAEVAVPPPLSLSLSLMGFVWHVVARFAA